MAVFPFSRGKNRISQGVENRGSLISVSLALRVLSKAEILGVGVFSLLGVPIEAPFFHREALGAGGPN